jgi:aryl-alcohol dehydrogenase-like predicted oxidoreductase
MEMRALGTSGVMVPVVGMGTWQTFDVRDRSEESIRARIVDTAIAAGAHLFDTSPMYGESERVLAATVRARRDDVIIADKVWASSEREGREQITRALEWYGGRIDVYQVHNLLAWRRHLPVLEGLRDEGKVRVIGASHYQHSAFAELLALMKSGRIAQIQIPYNARDRAVEREILPAAHDLGIGVLVMRPFGEGALLRKTPADQALAPLLEFGVHTWPQALLKWILSDPRVHCAIPATSKSERMSENAMAGAAPWFDSETRKYVARLT